jgi:hypothetical protein
MEKRSIERACRRANLTPSQFIRGLIVGLHAARPRGLFYRSGKVNE